MFAARAFTAALPKSCLQLSRRAFGQSAYGSITGKILSMELDGPRSRTDGTQFWMQRYEIEEEGGNILRASQFKDTEDSTPVAPVGTQARIRIKRRGDYTDVLGLDDGSRGGGFASDSNEAPVEHKELNGVVESIIREGPMTSKAGKQYWQDWYSIRTETEVVNCAKFADSPSEGHLALVGDKVTCTLRYKGNFTPTITVMQLEGADGDEPMRGTVEVVKRIPLVRDDGSTYQLEFYKVNVGGGRVREASRFIDDEGEPALCDVGQDVVVEIARNGPYTNVVSVACA
eukprot:TRINITY_DN2317_c0_g1_i2.p1 TRINITY_DN2317_c0_g1~~TRINITY_DN2317_c0_g1_i2.p1  ORF type:complete len:316 (+),score=139.70 TRINITY_DN2317_c0_g1_i2:90-950(+)